MRLCASTGCMDAVLCWAAFQPWQATTCMLLLLLLLQSHEGGLGSGKSLLGLGLAVGYLLFIGLYYVSLQASCVCVSVYVGECVSPATSAMHWTACPSCVLGTEGGHHPTASV